MTLSNLTPDTIRTLEPGVEIRRLVCEAMGWRVNPESGIILADAHLPIRTIHEHGIATMRGNCPGFCPDLSHDNMAEVLNWWLSKNSANQCQIFFAGENREHRVWCELFTDGAVMGKAFATRLPLALCRAVLLAVKASE